MTSLIEAIKNGPMLTMTLDCETKFPKTLKENMKTMGFKGEEVYKGFPVMDKGDEYWWVKLHLCENKEDNHKTEGRWMFTNPEPHTSFFDSARSGRWEDIEYIVQRIRFRLNNTQKYLKEVEEELEALKKVIVYTTTLLS